MLHADGTSASRAGRNGAATSERLVSLDAARGLGAFSVVLWHWTHFFHHGIDPGPLQPSEQPLYGLFYWLYSFGFLGVDFFFVLSGFIFFHFYYGAVADRRITAREFAKRRFARLYPLYGATLLGVILLQLCYFQLNGTTFVYPPGTVLDLLQAATLTSHWWPNPGFFFNGPGWSISVECFLYLVFFLAARFSGRYRTAVFVGLAIAGLGLNLVHWPIGRGLVSFFIGTLVAQSLMRLTSTQRFARAPGRVLGWTLGAGLCIFLALDAVPLALQAAGRIVPHAPELTNSVLRNLVPLIAFPYVVFLLALLERIRPMRARLLRLLGDCSYSIYLLHFPLQLVSVLIVDQLGLGREIFLNPLVFVAWCALLFLAGALSYYGFEKPLQRRIRSAGVSLAAIPASPAVS
jgi:peptidoglycan/LPS O-acetylase OafA/YrhL